MWFLSVIAVFVNLLYVYASLPEEVVVQDESSGRVLANREFFFYGITGVLLIVNVLVYLTSKLYEAHEEFRAWFHGLIITMNIFFILAMNLIQVYNSAEKFDYASVGFIVYGSVALVILWAVSWPAYSIFRKIFPKQAVL